MLFEHASEAWRQLYEHKIISNMKKFILVLFFINSKMQRKQTLTTGRNFYAIITSSSKKTRRDIWEREKESENR